MANSRFYSSTALETTLTNSITPSTLIIQVASTTGFPGSLPYTLAIDYGASAMELVEVTSVAGLNLTVTRAVDGTSAASHNSGAAVRHVSSARDFTDSRTHEAAIGAVHGLTGDIVGTTDTQTLTNKTINGAALSGTFSGSPTFSGAPTFSGGGTLTGTFAGTHTYSGAVTFSGVANLNGGGALVGTFSGNSTLSGTVTHSGVIQSTRAASTDVALGTQVSGDTFDRHRTYISGLHEWGSGTATRDTNLFRQGADILRTDDSFQVGGTLTVTGAATVGSLSTTGTAATGNLTVTGTVTGSGAADFGYNEVTTGITYATDFGAGSMIYRNTAGVHYVDVEVVRTGATFTPANTSGNVTPDLTIATLPAGSRPPSSIYILASTGVGHGSLRINTDGTCELLTWIPDPVTITNGSTIRFTATWID